MKGGIKQHNSRYTTSGQIINVEMHWGRNGRKCNQQKERYSPLDQEV